MGCCASASPEERQRELRKQARRDSVSRDYAPENDESRSRGSMRSTRASLSRGSGVSDREPSSARGEFLPPGFFRRPEFSPGTTGATGFDSFSFADGPTSARSTSEGHTTGRLGRSMPMALDGSQFEPLNEAELKERLAAMHLPPCFEPPKSASPEASRTPASASAHDIPGVPGAPGES